MICILFHDGDKLLCQTRKHAAQGFVVQAIGAVENNDVPRFQEVIPRSVSLEHFTKSSIMQHHDMPCRHIIVQTTQFHLSCCMLTFFVFFLLKNQYMWQTWDFDSQGRQGSSNPKNQSKDQVTSPCLCPSLSPEISTNGM